MNMGFSGTDVNDVAFNTGPQITRLNSFSLVNLFYLAKDKVTSTVSCCPDVQARVCLLWL